MCAREFFSKLWIFLALYYFKPLHKTDIKTGMAETITQGQPAQQTERRGALMNECPVSRLKSAKNVKSACIDKMCLAGCKQRIQDTHRQRRARVT